MEPYARAEMTAWGRNPPPPGADLDEEGRPILPEVLAGQAEKRKKRAEWEWRAFLKQRGGYTVSPSGTVWQSPRIDHSTLPPWLETPAE